MSEQLLVVEDDDVGAGRIPITTVSTNTVMAVGSSTMISERYFRSARVDMASLRRVPVVAAELGTGTAVARDSCIDLFTFEHVRVDGADGLRLVDADGAAPDRGVTVVTGPSGSGKTTLLRLCNRLDVATRGRVFHRGRDVSTVDPLVLRRRVGMLFQHPTPFGGTVRDNFRVAAPVTDDVAAATLERVGLEGSILGRQAHELSGGEAQRMCLARLLVTEPEVLLMDEPTASLDDEKVGLVEVLVCDLARSGVPVLWVTHDREQVERVADTVITVRSGRIERIDRRRESTDDA